MEHGAVIHCPGGGFPFGLPRSVPVTVRTVSSKPLPESSLQIFTVHNYILLPFEAERLETISLKLKNGIKTTSFTPPSVIKLHLLFAHALCDQVTFIVCTLGGVNEVVLIVLTSVTNQK
jgi:hypothetical protein